MNACREVVGDDLVPQLLALGPGDAAGTEVDERCDADVRAHLAERADGLGVAHQPHDQMDSGRSERNGWHFLQLTVGFAVGVSRHTNCCRVAGDLVLIEHRAVDGGEVGARVEHENRPFQRRSIEVIAGQAFFAGEVDWIETPDDDRLLGAPGFLIESSEEFEKFVVGLDALGHAAIGAMPREPAGVRE